MNKIKEYREKLGISRAELSRQSNIPLRTLENWEYGVSEPSGLKRLAKLAAVLNCKIEDLI